MTLNSRNSRKNIWSNTKLSKILWCQQNTTLTKSFTVIIIYSNKLASTTKTATTDIPTTLAPETVVEVEP